MKKILFVIVFFISFIELLADTTYVRLPSLYQSAIPRPNLTNSITTDHFVIHYQSPTTLTFATNTAQSAEYAYTKICDHPEGLNWKTPPNDENRGGNNLYDIYIVNDSYISGANGLAQPEIIGNWTYEFCPSFILINNEIETENDLKMVMAQCFSYATQMAYSFKDGMYDTWFSKNTAVWIAEEIYNYQFNYFLRYFNVGFDPVDPLDHPEFGIHTTYRVEGNYLYDWAGFLWPKFLAEWKNDPDIIRLIWDRFNSNPGDHVLSDIDYVLQNGYSTNLNEAAKFYAEWRYFTGDRDDGEHFHYAGEVGLPTSRLNPSFPTAQMYGFGGTVFLQYPATQDLINFTFDGQDGYVWVVNVLQEKWEPPINTIEMSLNNYSAGSIDVPTEECYSLVLIPVLLEDGVFRINYSYSATNYYGKKVFFTNTQDGSGNNLGGDLLLDDTDILSSGNSKWLRNSSNHDIKTLSERFITPTIIKHNNWNGMNANFYLTKNFNVTASNYNQNARFKYLKTVTVRNVIDGMSFDDAVPIKFNDPWYVKDQFDNQSGIGDFISQPSPYYPTGKYNQTTGGVFFDQGGPPLWTPPFYSSKVDAVFDAPLTVTGVPAGRNHKFYFKGWTGTEVQFENANALQTGVVFKDDIPGINPEVQARLKATQISGSQTAFDNNSQRKFLKTNDGKLYSLYESMNRIWLERSTDNGNNWEIVNQGSPIAEIDSKNPSMCLQLGALYIVFESENTIHLYEYLPDYNQTYFRQQFESSTYSYDTNPVITDCFNEYQSVTGPVIIWKSYCNDGFGGDPGLYYAVIKSIDNSIHSIGKVPNTTINSYTPSIAGNDPIHSPVTWKNSPMKFNLVWEQRGSTNSSIMYYQCELNNGTLSFNNYQNISYNVGFSLNSNPSLITIKDANNNFTSKVVWLGKRQIAAEEEETGPSSINSLLNWEYKTIFKDLSNNTQKIYGTKTNNPNINKLNNNSEFYFGYSEQNDLSGKVILGSNITTINQLDAFGKDVQISNGNTSNQVKANLFKSSSLPYYFSLSTDMEHVTPKKNVLSVLSGREGVVFKDTAYFYFTIGDILVNNLPVDFKELADTVDYNNPLIINSYLETEPFILNENSPFLYSVQYGVTDSIIASQLLLNGNYVNFKVELINNTNNEILGTFDQVLYSEYNVYGYNNIAYQVNTNGLGNIQAKLRLVITTNGSFNYSLSERFAEESVLGKRKLHQINLDGNSVVKEYNLEQNFPNPFNPATTIKYQIPKNSIVSLKVYDILGGEVATLVNEEKDAGRYEVSFNANSFASGVYIYKLQAGDFISSRKMILIK